MRKAVLFILAIAVIVSLTACGDESGPGTSGKIRNSENILSAIAAEVEEASQEISGEAFSVIDDLGESYEDYIKNKDKAIDFFGKSLDDSQKLYETIRVMSEDYFRYVASEGTGDDAWIQNMNAFYDVWDEGMETYYDVLDDSREDVFDRCDDILESEFYRMDNNEYIYLSDEISDEYFDLSDRMIDEFYDEYNGVYALYTDVWNSFYDGNSDIEDILSRE